MKIKFNKLALSAGIAMAAGSMSAGAAITSVPAPAQLVPLFFFNDGTTDGTNAKVDTYVRVITPKSVGSDTVINILSGYTGPTSPIKPSDTWTTANASLASNKIHWFWMNYKSVEILNREVPISADSETIFSAQEVGLGDVVPGTPGYLILVNDSAFQGGPATFQFEADAWLVNKDTATVGLPSVTSIPVFGMSDTADTTAYPTPANNVIEDHALVADPIASPIHSAIRTSSTDDSFKLRVVDIPMADTCQEGGVVGQTCQLYNNTLVAWADSNGGNSLMNIQMFAVKDEVATSLPPLSMPNQLNFVDLGWESGGDRTTGRKLNALGVVDKYATQAYLKDSASVRNADFMKLVMNSKALPASNLPAGAYSSVILFNVPTIKPVLGVYDKAVQPPIFGVDTGFFKSGR